ncbi:hypothetical protein, partial [Phascolarctobacterium faecium]|uniref:hypothetical protein n=1 Tax=Phascolarctobacterium faecium TaxID=33025 RepID=UPI003AB1EB7A
YPLKNNKTLPAMTICVIISLDIDEPISFAPPGAQSTCVFTQVLLTFMLQHIRNFDSNAVINNKKQTL